MNKYIKTPDYISFKSIVKKNYTLSSAQYMDLVMPNKNFLYVKDFLTRKLARKDLGSEVGSLSYIGYSTHYFVRTKALQSHSFLPDINLETALPVMPDEFRQMNLKENDIIISKDSNIGEAVILDKDYPNYMLSGALYRLPVKDQDKYYLLAFIKHDIFREQLDFIVPKGATIRHAKSLFLDCKIPLPNNNKSKVVQFISILTKSIIEKEKNIRKRHNTILQVIETELLDNQKKKDFIYKLPAIKDLEDAGRIDSSLFSRKYKEKIYLITNYRHGFKPLTEQNLILKPGPSLEVRLLGTRVDSNIFIKGFYRLITPKQITNYGTVKQEQYIGTPLSIATIEYGDILFGESGTGRSMVYLDNDTNTINNAHAHILRPMAGKCTLERTITIRCIMQYFKEIGIIDCLTVGGAGGHLSPSYFDRVYIPNFPNYKEKEISRLYHNPEAIYMTDAFTLENFQLKDNDFNLRAGIYELDKAMKHLKKILDQAIDNVINDKDVDIRFD